MAYPVAENHLLEAEGQLGRRLPTALRARLLANNGGEIAADGEAWQLFPVKDPSDRRTARKTANHLLVETRVARKWAGFPADAIAVAANGTGDKLILRAGQDQLERWDHETREVEPVLELAL